MKKLCDGVGVSIVKKYYYEDSFIINGHLKFQINCFQLKMMLKFTPTSMDKTYG